MNTILIIFNILNLPFVTVFGSNVEMPRESVIKVPVYEHVGLGNVLKSLISALSVNRNSKIEPNRGLTGNYETVLDARLVYNQSESNHLVVLSYDCWRWRVLKTEEDIQTTLENDFSQGFGCGDSLSEYFSSKVQIDLCYNRTLISSVVYNRIVFAIQQVKFTDAIYAEVNKIDVEFENTLAISVRTWTALHEEGVTRKYSFDDYAAAIRQMLIENSNIHTIVLSVDNESIFAEYLLFLTRFENVSVVPLFKHSKIGVLNYLQRSVVKMLVMSKCAYFICNRISTFSELVFWFSGCTQRVIPLM